MTNNNGQFIGLDNIGKYCNKESNNMFYLVTTQDVNVGGKKSNLNGNVIKGNNNGNHHNLHSNAINNN